MRQNWGDFFTWHVKAQTWHQNSKIRQTTLILVSFWGLPHAEAAQECLGKTWTHILEKKWGKKFLALVSGEWLTNWEIVNLRLHLPRFTYLLQVNQEHWNSSNISKQCKIIPDFIHTCKHCWYLQTGEIYISRLKKIAFKNNKARTILESKRQRSSHDNGDSVDQKSLERVYLRLETRESLTICDALSLHITEYFKVKTWPVWINRSQHRSCWSKLFIV